MWKDRQITNFWRISSIYLCRVEAAIDSTLPLLSKNKNTLVLVLYIMRYTVLPDCLKRYFSILFSEEMVYHKMAYHKIGYYKYWFGPLFQVFEISTCMQGCTWCVTLLCICLHSFAYHASKSSNLERSVGISKSTKNDKLSKFWKIRNQSLTTKHTQL